MRWRYVAVGIAAVLAIYLVYAGLTNSPAVEVEADQSTWAEEICDAWAENLVARRALYAPTSFLRGEEYSEAIAALRPEALRLDAAAYERIATVRPAFEARPLHSAIVAYLESQISANRWLEETSPGRPAALSEGAYRDGNVAVADLAHAWSSLAAGLKDSIARNQECSLVVTHLGSMPRPSSTQAEVEGYLRDALDWIGENALYRDRIDWQAVRAQAERMAAGAMSPVQTYPAIRYALNALADNHSRFVDPSGQSTVSAQEAGTAGQGVIAASGPEALNLTPSVSYIWVPAFSGTSLEASTYADRMQTQIRTADTPQACGWVVDLRGNTGGNMWPMLAGVGPILGEGTAGSFVAPRRPTVEWNYAGGRSLGGTTVVTVVPEPYALGASPPVAALTSRMTVSSGEAVAVAFRGRENTRFFGTETGGLSTSNESRNLRDGARIILTTAVFADRHGNVYGGVIAPDEFIETAAPHDRSASALASDPAVQAAVAWLASVHGCR